MVLSPVVSVKSLFSAFSLCQSLVCGSAVSTPTIATTQPIFCMNSIWVSNIFSVSVSNPTMNPPITCIPCCCIILTVSARFLCTFCIFPASFSPSTLGVSIPRNTFEKFAFVIKFINSSSSARLVLASVSSVNGYLCSSCHFMMCGSNSLALNLLPMKLSSTTNTVPFHPASYSVWNSVCTCSGVFVLGTLPFIITMSQNSQLNGHPLEYCIAIAAYFVMSHSSHCGFGVFVTSGLSVDV